MLNNEKPAEEEPILSAELLAELGGDDAGNVILTGKKKKRKHNPDEVTEEVKTLAKQLSKKAQKRVAQITQRKEKEAKRSDFLSTIHEHEISEEHRQLLTSSRGINQTLTMKQLLSNIFKKQAAGLTLTPEESQLLYNQPAEGNPVDTSVLPPNMFTAAAPIVDSTLLNAESSPDDVFLSFDDIIPLNSGTDADAFNNKQKKAKRKKNKGYTADDDDDAQASTSKATAVVSSATKDSKAAVVTAPVVTAPVPVIVASEPAAASGSVGFNLLAQLKKLKEGSVPSTKKAHTGSTSIANAAEEAGGGAAGPSAYLVQETACPVSSQGEVVRAAPSAASETAAEKATTDAASSKGKGVAAGASASATSSAAAQKAVSDRATAVRVNRSAEVQAARMELPVCHMEQEIVEAVNNAANDAIILCGETGSGKSTQVPQFLYECGYGIGGMIGITQPRRVAVTSTAQRVSYEMTSGVVADAASSAEVEGGAVDKNKNGKKASKKGGKQDGSASNQQGSGVGDNNNSKRANNSSGGQLVGYQIRFDSSTVGPDTRIKFMTDGILLKEVAQDLLLRKYRVVILDEAHERNMNTDVLLGMLSKVLPLRRAQAAFEQAKYDSLPPAERANYAMPLQPLKLIIMSATMRVNDFQNPRLFPAALPPIIKVEARQYPVTTHFAKRTETVNYLKETHKKVCQIHRKLPEGGVLVFLTGKQEILYMCHKLAKSLNKRSKAGLGAGATVAGDAAAVADSTVSPLDGAVAVDDEVEVSGLGASAEEQMELQEGTHTGTQQGLQRRHKGSKATSSKKGKQDDDGEDGPSMRELLMQDEISSDSEGDDGADSDASGDDEDSDNESHDNRSSKATSAALSTSAANAASTAAAAELTAEEALYVLDGDDNHHKSLAGAVAGTGRAASVQSKVQSAKQGLVTGDSVRDQLLREALGVDPSAISEGALLGQDSTDAKGAQGASEAAGTNANAASAAAEEAPEPAPLRAWILPLYALMPAALQNRVFQPPPPGHRLIVVATNVAETSITIPGIRYVVDSGRQKERVLTSATPATEQEQQQKDGTGPGNKRSFEGTKVVPNDVLTAAQGGASSGAGVAKYEVKWVSQAAAEQRQGRAGRTGPGHCYRLYSANFYHQYLQPYQPPEITVTPLEELILQMKALGIDHVDRFPFPTPPPPHSVRNALSLLTNLGAIAAAGSTAATAAAGDGKKVAAGSAKGSSDLTAEIAMATMNVMKHNTALHQKQLQQLQELHKQQQQARELCPLTGLGKVLARFPINPRFAKMLVMAYRATGLPINSGGGGAGPTMDLTVQSKDKFALLAHALTLVATLAERSAFESTNTGGADKSKKPKTGAGTGAEAGDSDSCSSEDDGAAEEADKNTHFLFHHEDGDALARLRATGAYVHAVTSFLRSAAAEAASAKSSKGDKAGSKPVKMEVTLGKREVLSANESAMVKALCSTHRLHAPTLQRIIELRDQLQDISASVLLPAPAKRPASAESTEKEDKQASKQLLAVPAAPPSSAQELALRQLILSGFCDSIARRAPLGVVKTGPRRRRLTAYFSSHPALLDVPLYLHPGSNLYRKDPTATLPEFVTYGALVHNQRGDCVYMTCVSTISASWVASVAADCPLLKWSAPLASPAPYYDPSTDTVMCCVIPRFGAHNWELPVMRRPLIDCTADAAQSGGTIGTPLGFRKQDEVYRWFAKLLLEGGIFAAGAGAGSSKYSTLVSAAAVREVRAALGKSKLTDASAAVVIQMKPIPKVSNLLRKLVNREVCNATALLQVLASDPSFLSEEVQDFLNVEHRKEFRGAWLKLAASAAENARK